MDKESLFIKMEDINKGNGRIICWKDKGLDNFQMEIIMKDHFLKIYLKGKEFLFSKLVDSNKAFGETDIQKEQDNKNLAMENTMLVNLKKINFMGMGHILIKMIIYWFEGIFSILYFNND